MKVDGDESDDYRCDEGAGEGSLILVKKNKRKVIAMYAFEDEDTKMLGMKTAPDSQSGRRRMTKIKYRYKSVCLYRRRRELVLPCFGSAWHDCSGRSRLCVFVQTSHLFTALLTLSSNFVSKTLRRATPSRPGRERAPRQGAAERMPRRRPTGWPSPKAFRWMD